MSFSVGESLTSLGLNWIIPFFEKKFLFSVLLYIIPVSIGIGICIVIGIVIVFVAVIVCPASFFFI